MNGVDELFKDLNPRQREAASHGMTPLLIVAGAGTGKTATLVHRVAWLIAQGIPPQRILLLTFTRRAAAEMIRRTESLVARLRRGGVRVRQTWGGTFHSTAHRLLRRFAKQLSLRNGFAILDRSDAEDLMNLARSEQVGTAIKHSRFPRKETCLAIYSRCINGREQLGDVLQKDFPWCISWEEELAALFDRYVRLKRESDALDYDDLLLYWEAAMRQPEIGDQIRAMFECVLVDEYQDTNILQAEILYRLSPEGYGLTVVGDDAQSIYSFRAATVRNILDFPKHYPDATIVFLEQNYRSTRQILDVANAVIGQATTLFRKTLWSPNLEGVLPRFVACADEQAQAEYVAEEILARRESGVELMHQAVLFRAAHHSLVLEAELNQRNIPYRKYGGLRFTEMAHIKDLLAFLRLADNPRDFAAGMRTLKLLPGIGDARAKKLLSQVANDEAFAVWRSFKPGSTLRPWWGPFLELMERLREGHDPLPVQVSAVRAFYDPLVELLYDNPNARKRDLDQMEIIAGRFKSRRRMLAELALDPPSIAQEESGQPKLDEEYLVLSTIHSAKGLEWDTVFVIHASDGNIPSDMALSSPDQLEEELRLFYVALTRAKRALHVCCPVRYYLRLNSDEHCFAQRTRFLSEDILKRFESIVYDGKIAGDDPSKRSPRFDASETVGNSLSGLWAKKGR